MIGVPDEFVLFICKPSIHIKSPMVRFPPPDRLKIIETVARFVFAGAKARWLTSYHSLTFGVRTLLPVDVEISVSSESYQLIETKARRSVLDGVPLATRAVNL